jgi:hypothetical protein
MSVGLFFWSEPLVLFIGPLKAIAFVIDLVINRPRFLFLDRRRQPWDFVHCPAHTAVFPVREITHQSRKKVIELQPNPLAFLFLYLPSIQLQLLSKKMSGTMVLLLLWCCQLLLLSNAKPQVSNSVSTSGLLVGKGSQVCSFTYSRFPDDLVSILGSRTA